MPRAADITANLDSVRRRITAAAQRVHRSPAHITLVAVSKTFGASDIRAAAAAGQLSFGENKLQEAAVKRADLADLPARLAPHRTPAEQQGPESRHAPSTRSTPSIVIDLLRRLDAAAGESGTHPGVLLQVDLAGEPTKSGAPRGELRALVEAALTARHLHLQGLMLIPPARHRRSRHAPGFVSCASCATSWWRPVCPTSPARLVDGDEPGLRSRRRRRRHASSASAVRSSATATTAPRDTSGAGPRHRRRRPYGGARHPTGDAQYR